MSSDVAVSTDFGDMKDAEAFIRETLKRAEAANDYSFDCKITTYKKGKAIKEGGKFYFKKPTLMRVEVTEGGKKGAVAVIGKDGKVRGHLGGLLKMFTGTLAKDSHMLRSANNYSMVESDYETLLNTLLKEIGSGYKTYVSPSPVKVDYAPDKAYVVEIYEPGDKKVLAQRMFVDQQSKLPEQWNLYRKGELFSVTEWRNIKVNSNLPDELFDLKYKR